MKQTRVTQSRFSSRMLKAALCIALCGMAYPQAMHAELISAPQAVQNGTITGTVIDEEGEPVIGASVKVKGQEFGVSTDFDGNFAIKAKKGDVLVIASVGMKPAEVTVTSNKIDVTMHSDSKLMDEVVVIGYGTQKKGDITSAVASVKAEDFTGGKIGDAAELVKGKIAGLSVVNSSGDPLAGSSIMLRGVTTVSGSVSPLVLIDGIEGSLNTVAPENIAEIDVLKDASAAAIYGTRGANGVILITTKSGKRDAHATASYSNYFAWSEWTKKYKFMDTHDIIYGLTAQPYMGYETDWLKAVTRKAGFKHNHSFQVSGGTTNATYAANVTYSNDEGIMRGSDIDRLKMQMDYTQYMWNDILKFNFNVLVTRTKYLLNNNNAGGHENVYRQALIHNPSEPVYNEDGTYYENLDKLQYYNPVAIQNEYEGNTRNRFWQIAGNVTVEPIKGWQTNLMMVWGESTSSTESWTSHSYPTMVKQTYNGTASKSESNSISKTLELTSRYSKNFGGVHRFEGLVGYSYNYNIYDNFGASNSDFSTDAYKWNNLNNGSFLRDKDKHAWMGSGRSDNTLVGFFGRVSYGYDNKYNILASLRYEGSSEFGANNKWATFPSVSLGWNIQNESFMEPTRAWLDNLRLRLGYGVTGITPQASYMSIYKYNYDPYGDAMAPDGNWIKTLLVDQNQNKDLKWQTTHEWNFGLDYGFLNSRIRGTLDFYIKQTNDLLYWYDVPVPPNLYNQTFANVGKIRNTGFEFSLTGIAIDTRDFQWTTTVTLSHNVNKLISLSNTLYETEDFHEVGGVSDPISVPTHCMEVGSGLGDFWGLKFAGYDKDGFALVEVKNAQGEWELAPFDTNLNIKENRQRLGNGMPKFYFGWNHTFRYRDFDLSLQFTGQFGYKILNASRCFYENNSIAYNRLKTSADLHPAINLDGSPYIDPETGKQKMVAMSSSMSQGFWSDHLEPGDFLKLTNLTLGYTVPLKGSVKNYISNLRIFGSASNLFCITKYSGLDPEVSNWYMAPGVDDRDKYPTVRSYTVGLNLTF